MHEPSVWLAASIAVVPLNLDQTHKLVARQFGLHRSAVVDADVGDYIFKQSGGNPMVCARIMGSMNISMPSVTYIYPWNIVIPGTSMSAIPS